MPYTLTLVRGEQPQANGVELDNPHEENPVFLKDLPQETQDWVLADDPEDLDVWVLVTPAGEHVNAVNVLDVHTAR